MLYHDCYSSPIGKLFIVADEEALLRIDFENKSDVIEEIEPYAINHQKIFTIDNLVLQKTKAWLENYFRREYPSSIPPIRFEGSAFRVLVWKLLLNIPYGKTISYSELGSLVAKERGLEKMSAQAIGQAVGKNPISIIVPCHRVIGKKGELVGYGGGIDRKKFLLELERRNT